VAYLDEDEFLETWKKDTKVFGEMIKRIGRKE
jgi:hypothetical protein